MILVQVDRDAQIRDGLFEHAEAGVAPSARQVMQRTCFIGLFNDALEVTDGVVEAMKGKVEDAAKQQNLLIFRAVLESSGQVFLRVLQHLVLGLWLDRFVHGVLHDRHGAQKVRVTLVGLYLSCAREERDGLLIVRRLLGLEVLETLTQHHIIVLIGVQLLHLGRLLVVAKAFFVLLEHYVAVCSVDEKEREDVIFLVVIRG